MKKHLLALAALATVSSVAAAQSVTMYGIVDLSVTSASNASANSGTGRFTGLTDAVWLPSVIGFTGSEDLGNGLKATFNLESDVNMDTGALSGASGTKLFGRKANVGLSGNFGSLSLGKDIDMIFLQGFIDNIRNSHSAGGYMAHTLATYATSSQDLDKESVFIQNSVKYSTPTIAGLKATVQHKFGEVAGNSSASGSTAFMLNYSPLAGLTLAAATKEMKDASENKTELTYLGATYQFGAFKLAATHHKTKYKNAQANDVKTQEYGASYAVNPKLTAAVNYVKTEQGANEGDIKSASLKYALSKRTSLWTMVAKTNYDGLNIGGGNYGVTVQSGKDNTATAVGVTHTF
jgi:predicted porin